MHEPGTNMPHEAIQRFAQLALDGVHRPYPYQVAHTFLEPGPIASPSAITPVFYGCYDWHSAVHGHWLLARARTELAGTPFAGKCSAALARSLQPEPLSVECAYLRERPWFERPYGLAWLLALAAELDGQHDTDARNWRDALRPLEEVVADEFLDWLPKLSHPVRSGTHNQTAFGMTLAWDWAMRTDHPGMLECLRERAHAFFGEDRDYPLHLEPSGEDFFSASLSAASLMTRVCTPEQFTAWFNRVMPELGLQEILEPPTPSDRRDGRLVHLDGLNLSRAWMLHEIANTLPESDSRRAGIARVATRHEAAGLEAIAKQEYAGTHWLGTFAMYLLDVRRPR